MDYAWVIEICEVAKNQASVAGVNAIGSCQRGSNIIYTHTSMQEHAFGN